MGLPIPRPPPPKAACICAAIPPPGPPWPIRAICAIWLKPGIFPIKPGFWPIAPIICRIILNRCSKDVNSCSLRPEPLATRFRRDFSLSKRSGLFAFFGRHRQNHGLDFDQFFIVNRLTTHHVTHAGYFLEQPLQRTHFLYHAQLLQKIIKTKAPL